MKYMNFVHVATVPAVAVFAVLCLSQMATSARAADTLPTSWPAHKPFPKLAIVERTTEPLLKADKPWEYWFYYLGTSAGHDSAYPDKVRFGNGIGRFKLRLDVP